MGYFTAPAYGTAASFRRPRIVVGVTEEPISVEEARQHLEAQPYGDSGLDGADDAMIEGFIAAAREYCENYTGLSFAPVTLEAAFDNYPTCVASGMPLAIELPFGPVREVLSVTHGDGSDDANVDGWVLDRYSSPARLTPLANAQLWPTLEGATNLVKVQYTAGYGDIDSDGFGEPLPGSAKTALLLMVGHLYRNREATTDSAMATLPLGVQSMLRPYRARLGMA
jgi:uncharacterized phiE125 gp8 family phage protein